MIVLYGMGYGMGIVSTLSQEGYKVGYIFDKDRVKFKDNLEQIIKSWSGEVLTKYGDDDFFIVDDIVNKKWDKLPRLHLVGNEYGDKIEDDRKFMMDEARKVGLDVGEFKEFHTIEEGKDFVRHEKGEWVIKLSGKFSLDKWTTYVSKGTEDMLDFMDFLAKYYKTDKIDYILQQKFNGVEVALTHWNGSYFMNFEYKNFMKWSRYKTGEMGTLVKKIDKDNEIIKASKIDDFLAEVRNHGEYNVPFDINMIADKDGLHFLEPTCRFGYPTLSIIMGMYKYDRGMMFTQAAKGEDFSADFTDKWTVGIVVNTPPSPYEIDDEKIMKKLSDIPINEKTISNHHNVVFEGLYKEDDMWKASLNGYDAVVSGIGNTIEEANSLANKLAEFLNIPLSFWRTDIGLLDIKNVDKLKQWGYLNDKL